MTEYEIVSGFGLDPARAGGARERPDASVRCAGAKGKRVSRCGQRKKAAEQ